MNFSPDNSDQSDISPGSFASGTDMSVLVRRVRDFISEHADIAASVVPAAPDELADRFGFSVRPDPRPKVVLAADTAVELGHPSTESLSLVLFSDGNTPALADSITFVGPDIPQLAGIPPRSFAQVILLHLEDGGLPDPFDLENAAFLMHRLPGYMIRSVPGRMWVRISHDGLAAGIDFRVVGSALVAAYKSRFDYVKSVEVLFVTSGKGHVNILSEIEPEARILSGRHKKLYLGIDGEIECRELNCDVCDEKAVCDNLRDIVIKRRRSGDAR